MDFALLKNILPKKLRDWTSEDVYVWLRFIHLEKLYKNLDNIDGKGLLKISKEQIPSVFKTKSSIITKKLIKWLFFGIPAYEQYLEENNFESSRINSEHSSIFSRTFTNDRGPQSSEQLEDNLSQINPENGDQLHETTVQTEDEDGQNAMTVQRALKSQSNSKSPNKMDILASVKKPPSKPIVRELLITSDEGPFKKVYEFKNRGGTIGRSESSDIMVLGQECQEVHTHIEFQSPKFYLRNADMFTKTWIKLDKKTKLQHGDFIQMGSQQFNCQIQEDQYLNLKLRIKPSLFRPGQNYITRSIPPIEGKLYRFGRLNKYNNWAFCQDLLLSGKHAVLYFLDGGWFIEDFESSNGTWLLLRGKREVATGMIFRCQSDEEHFHCSLKDNGDEVTDLVIPASQSSLCPKCKDNLINTFFFPCMHSCICRDCEVRIGVTKCLQCGKKVTEVVKFFAV